MKKIFLLFLILSLSALLIAVPASPEPVVVEYENGKSLTVYLHGDENYNWLTTSDGLRVKENADGRFEYVQKDFKKAVADKKMIAHDPEYRDADERTFVSQLDKEVVI